VEDGRCLLAGGPSGAPEAPAVHRIAGGGLAGRKATDGPFNYEVPAGTDVSQFKSAIVWCRRFSVLFAAAPLAAD